MSEEKKDISQMSLVRKLIAITSEIGSLEKKGKADMGRGGKYDYVKGEMAMADFRPFEVKYGIKVLTEVAEDTVTTVQKEGAGFLTTGVIRYHIHDADSDQVLTASVLASGYDATDKGSYKAMTGAFKYFVLQEFSASTDDPEKDNEVETKPKTKYKSSGTAKSTSFGKSSKGSSGFSKKTEADTTTTATTESTETKPGGFSTPSTPKFSKPSTPSIMTKDEPSVEEKSASFSQASNSDTSPSFKKSKFADKF